jgi:N-acetylmuramoyl-L-alanine amidase
MSPEKTKADAPSLRPSMSLEGGAPRRDRPRRGAGFVLALGLLLVFAPPAQAWLFRGLGLTEYLAPYGFGPPSEHGRNAVYRSRATTLIVESGSRRVTVNGVTIYLNQAIEKRNGDWAISPVDAADTLGALLRPSWALRKVSAALVMLDPGHGGADPGASTAGGLQEKRLTLDVATRVRRRLRENGVSVLTTRERDRAVDLDERCFRAAQLGANVFVSIHFNASRDRNIAGVETFIVPAAGYPATSEIEGRRAGNRGGACPGNRFDGANAVLAEFLQRGLLSQTGAPDRGIRRARYYVIRNAPCPAALVECGFLSNPGEVKRVQEAAYRDRLAEGIARGVLTYLSRVREQKLPPVHR